MTHVPGRKAPLPPPPEGWRRAVGTTIVGFVVLIVSALGYWLIDGEYEYYVGLLMVPGMVTGLTGVNMWMNVPDYRNGRHKAA